MYKRERPENLFPARHKGHSFTDFIIPQIASSWNAGMLVIMVLIGGFMFMLSACGGTEAFGQIGRAHV